MARIMLKDLFWVALFVLAIAALAAAFSIGPRVLANFIGVSDAFAGMLIWMSMLVTTGMVAWVRSARERLRRTRERDASA